MSNAMVSGYQKDAKEIFLDFCNEQIEQEKMKVCFRNFYEKIVFMQKRMKDQLVIRYSKIDILHSAWDVVYAFIMRKASSRKDQNVMKFLQKIAILDMTKRMKNECLIKYLNQCRRLHSIAFLQWRIKYPTKFTNIRQCEKLIAKMSNNIHKKIRYTWPTEDTIKAATLPNAMYDKYKLLETARKDDPPVPLFYVSDKPTHKINAFADIGWCDPFANENKKGILQ